MLTTVTRGGQTKVYAGVAFTKTGIMIGVDDYVAFLEGEYLHGYVDGGGAAVKFVVPPDDGVGDGVPGDVQPPGGGSWVCGGAGGRG